MAAKLVRLSIAFVGAFAITAGLLLSMNQVAETLRLRDPTKYFHITDVIVLPSSKRPERPPQPERPPERARADIHLRGRPDLGVAIPSSPGPAQEPSTDIPPITLPEETQRLPK